MIANAVDADARWSSSFEPADGHDWELDPPELLELELELAPELEPPPPELDPPPPPPPERLPPPPPLWTASAEVAELSPGCPISAEQAAAARARTAGAIRSLRVLSMNEPPPTAERAVR
jgi:hypothetical protein